MEHFSSPSFGLVLVISRASQYEVDGGLGFRWMFNTRNCSIGCGGSFCPRSALECTLRGAQPRSIFLPGTLSFSSGWFHGRGPCGNRTSRIDYVGPDSPSLEGAISNRGDPG